jgi:hypothetical protein
MSTRNGRLSSVSSGGILHDSNNVLTVITGTIEILAEAVGDRPQLDASAPERGLARGARPCVRTRTTWLARN